MRTLQFLFDQFPQARTNGLTAAEVTDSRFRFGANELTPLPRESAWKKFVDKFDEPIIKILLAASLLKIIVDLFEISPLAGGIAMAFVILAVVAAYLLKRAEWVPSLLFALAVVLFGLSLVLRHPSVEGLAVIVAVVLATGVSFLSEYRSDREFEKLNARKDSVRVKVMRDAQIQAVSLEDVVVGDLVVLEMGDEIPADGRVVTANPMFLDQSLMTGESEPVRKRMQPDADESDGPDAPGCVYRGTQVVDGLGAMVVTNVGDDTMLGQIARRLSSEEPTTDDHSSARVHRKLTLSKEQTPLQLKLTHLAELISKVGYWAAAAIFLAMLIRGLYFTTPAEVFWPTTRPEFLTVVNHLLGYFVYMVIVIVVAVPEGLPMSVTVSLAMAMRKMTRANALVRQLVATETIGSATVICSDKTGTLTQNKMQVVRVGVDGAVLGKGENGFFPPLVKGIRPIVSAPIGWIAVNAAVNSTGTLEEKNGLPVVIGSSTEGSLLLWLRDGGTNYLAERFHHPALYRSAFSSEHKKMTTVTEICGTVVALVKGAPEVVLELCSHITNPDGTVRPITATDRVEVQRHLAIAAGESMRTLAFAHKSLPEDLPRDTEAITHHHTEWESVLTFDGFVAIRDPLRGDVRLAIERCRSAGIEVKMITGDNPETARAIAAEAGLLDPDSIVLNSAELASLTDEQLKDQLPRLRVVARAKPLDKYRLVKLLQEQNHVVAMTGDGTNDAPSLKKADVGLAMGIAGSEVAKEASKIVLLDDAFSTIVKAVHWGRSLYENIQRFIQFQLTINFSALLIAFLGPFFGLKPPFTVLQLLWINVIMDTFAAIALCSEPPRSGLMRMPPKRRDESIVTRSMFYTILCTGLFFVVVMIGLLVGMEYFGWFAGDSPASDAFPELTTRQVTLFFTVYVFFQVWNQINCRSLTPDRSGFRGLFRNPLFLLIASLTVIGQVLIVNFGGKVFAVEPLRVTDWMAIALGTMSVLVFAELSRGVRRFLLMEPGTQ